MNVENIQIQGFDEILKPDAMTFIEQLEREFCERRSELLQKRVERQKIFNAGTLPDFLSETADVRATDWKIGSIPADLQDRRVEITGPTDRKMIINAMNSGANIFMADF